MKSIVVKNFGPIADANVTIGDMTLFVGPQASGKSLLLQLLTFLQDKLHIRATLEQHNFTWQQDADQVLDQFLGEGVSSIWGKHTEVVFDGKKVLKEKLPDSRGARAKSSEQSVFYIPAQRIMTLDEGYPRQFNVFSNTTPYVLRDFSETIRLYLEGRKSPDVFPISNVLKDPLRKELDKAIFHGGKISVHKEMRKTLRMTLGATDLPFMTWSAGQKEFLPLLLALQYLNPPARVARRDGIEYVILEEPEMGLHPRGIKTIILTTLDLISKGYKVIVSTHSPVWLEAVWAIQFLKKSNAPYKSLFSLFDLPQYGQLDPLFKSLMEKLFSVYYFRRVENEQVHVKDISDLDAGADDPDMAEWGGIQSFATRATEVVANSMAK